MDSDVTQRAKGEAMHRRSVRDALGRFVDDVAARLAERRVDPGSLRVAAAAVSVAAGFALAAGGAAGEPRAWLLVPPLGLVRLVLFAVESRLVDSRPTFHDKRSPDVPR